jgi:ATP-dependent Lhr-like helicase
VGEAEWARVLGFVGNGGYALRAYDRFRRIVPLEGRPAGFAWPSRHGGAASADAGIIVDEMIEVRFRNGRRWAGWRRFAAQLGPGRPSASPGSIWRWRAAAMARWWCARPRQAGHPSYMGAAHPDQHPSGRAGAGLLHDPAAMGRVSR